MARNYTYDTGGIVMNLRVGKVTNIYPSTGKVKVMYEDAKSASLPLAMLTMNNEYSLPAVGDRVVTLHMENGSSKGFVLGTYYGGGTQPKANTGYRKDFGKGAYATCRNGAYSVYAGAISLRCGDYHILLKEDMEIAGKTVLIEAEDGHLRFDVDTELFATGDMNLEAEGDATLKATNVTIEAEELTLKCAYGEITVEDLMKRLERIEDKLGLPHTI